MESICCYCLEEIKERGSKDTCKTCYDINEGYKKLKRQKYVQYRKDNALCLNCGKPLDNDLVNCDNCRKKLNERNLKWYYNNKEHAKKKQKEYNEKNKERLRRKQKEYYEKNKERIRVKQLEYYHRKKGVNNEGLGI